MKVHDNLRLQIALHRLEDDGPERLAIDAGEIDALIDYEDKNVILFPTAKRSSDAAPASLGMPDPRANAILAALPSKQYQHLRQHLEPVMLSANELLQQWGTPIRYVYFPIDGVISLFVAVENRRVLEVALVGSEGMIGFPLAIGREASSVHAIVGITGCAIRLPEQQFREVYRHNPALREQLNRYTYTELAVARQTAACCTFHVVEQRFARRLLMIADRLRSDRFTCTHESAAYALGVRRESITQAAGTLHSRGLISYYRGDMRILNREGLESASCRCYTRIENRPIHAKTG